MKTLFSIFLIFSVLCGCSSRVKDLTSAEGTIKEGDALLEDDFYEEARKQYLRVKTEFPSSSLQYLADLKLADTYYKEESFKAAAESYQDFIKTYPGRPEISEALYKLGMSYANQMPSTAQRDTRATSKTVDTFTRLMIDFPDSPHSQEAQEWITKARTQLASKVWEIARFYERMKQYDSAARRYGEFYDQYADDNRAEEAFARQIRNLRRSQETDRADALTQVFEEKFPNSKFTSTIRP